MTRLPDNDLNWLIERSINYLESIRGEHIFITGGTGFIGSWLLDCLCYANNMLGLNLRIRVLSRTPDGFNNRYPHLATDPSVELVKGDVRNLEPDGKRYDIVIHAATDASAQLNKENPLLMADTIVEGTRRALEFARLAGARRVLMLSSGAVYGRFMSGVTHAPENYPGGPDPLDVYYTYSESKRMAELLCAIYAKQFGLEIPIARLFAFVGPRLPLDTHFAVGNFIRDALAGESIKINGDGTAVRSYLYAAEMIAWLLAILERGRSGHAYNVGSDKEVSIRELADMVAATFSQRPSVIVTGQAGASNPVNHYVPDVTRARVELGLTVTIPLADAISRTVTWNQGVATE